MATTALQLSATPGRTTTFTAKAAAVGIGDLIATSTHARTLPNTTAAETLPNTTRKTATQ